MVEKYLLAPEGFFCYLALFAAFFAFFWWRRKDWRIAFIITFGIAMPTLLIPALATATSSKVIEPMFSQLFWGYISIFPMHVIGGLYLVLGRWLWSMKTERGLLWGSIFFEFIQVNYLYALVFTTSSL